MPDPVQFSEGIHEGAELEVEAEEESEVEKDKQAEMMMEQMTELDAQLTVFLVRPIIGIVNNSKVLATLALNVEME